MAPWKSCSHCICVNLKKEVKATYTLFGINKRKLVELPQAFSVIIYIVTGLFLDLQPTSTIPSHSVYYIQPLA